MNGGGSSSVIRRPQEFIDHYEYESSKNPSKADLLSVPKRVVFDSGTKTRAGPFVAKLKLENLSCRYVAFTVRPSNKEKFKIRPKYGFVGPRASLDVTLETRDTIKNFPEIAKECFGVFAVPIYDKRQLERKKLSLLWRVHGTDLLPFEAVETHKIPYILPKSDKYFADLSMLGRLSELCYLRRFLDWNELSVVLLRNDTKPVDEETFQYHWPNEGPRMTDLRVDKILEDWHLLCSRLQDQTNNVIDDAKQLGAILICVGIMIFGMSCFYLSDAADFGITISGIESQNATTAAAAAVTAAGPTPNETSWFNWVLFSSN